MRDSSQGIKVRRVKTLLFAITRKQVALGPVGLISSVLAVLLAQLALIAIVILVLELAQVPDTALLAILAVFSTIVLIPLFLGALLILDLMWQAFGIYRLIGMNDHFIKMAVGNLVGMEKGVTYRREETGSKSIIRRPTKQETKGRDLQSSEPR
jgi:hypothetical protein